MTLYAVIMAGGAGERFWPESRQDLPKQFLKFLGSQTMIQETIQRISPLVPLERVLIVSNKNHAPLIHDQLPVLKQDQVLLEPYGRNTAPCIGLAAAFLNRLDPDAVMVVLPADHWVGESEKFLEAIQEASWVAEEEESLVTIGIKPNTPETGYGYIHLGAKYSNSRKIKFFHVQNFVEKPTRQRAQAYLKNGHYLWNSGIFIWRVGTVLDAIKIYLPELYQGIQSLQKQIGSPKQEEAIQKMYEKAPKISVDYGIMEKARNVLVALGEFNWDDVGSWSSLERHLKKDNKGNIVMGDHVLVDTQGTLVMSRKGVVAALGLKDLVVIHSPDAVLVMDKSRAQEVKKIIELMKGYEKYQRYL